MARMRRTGNRIWTRWQQTLRWRMEDIYRSVYQQNELDEAGIGNGGGAVAYAFSDIFIIF